MIIQDTPRTTVECISHQGKRCIKKTFKKIGLIDFETMITVMFHNSITPEIIDIDPENRSFIRPYYPYNLRDYLVAKDGEADRHSLGTHLALGLFDLWNQGYIHRDVHAENIYVSEAGVLFLCDWEHVCERESGIPFWHSPDFVGGGGVHAFWDKGCRVDINTILGLDSMFVINIAKEALVRSLEHSGGAYWERLSKGQIYGSIDVPGFKQEGRRDPKARLDQFRVNLAGKTVLDLGCNAGAMSFEAFNRGASKVMGLELLAPRIDTARSIANFAGIDDRVSFYQHNFDRAYAIPNAPFDVVFAFAIDHQTSCRLSLYRLLCEVTSEVLLLESSLQKEHHNDIMNDLAHAGFKTVEYVGDSTASDRKKRCRMCYRAYKHKKVD
jgi:hypothetical protein